MTAHVGRRCRAHRPLASLCASAWLMLVSPPGATQDSVALTSLQRCASIAADAARLACYDAVTEVARRTSSNAPVATPTADSRGQLEGAPDSSPATSAGVDAFGSEQVDDPEISIPDEIQSRLVGEFSGWRGNTVFRLENGQVWRQSDDGRLVFQADAPLVTIRRGAFGTYRLSAEGVNSAVRVRRVE